MGVTVGLPEENTGRPVNLDFGESVAGWRSIAKSGSPTTDILSLSCVCWGACVCQAAFVDWLRYLVLPNPVFPSGNTLLALFSSSDHEPQGLSAPPPTPQSTFVYFPLTALWVLETIPEEVWEDKEPRGTEASGPGLEHHGPPVAQAAGTWGQPFYVTQQLPRWAQMPRKSRQWPACLLHVEDDDVGQKWLGGRLHMWGGGGAGGVWKFSVPSSQFCYAPKSVL